MSARRTGPALEATYRFLLWLVAAVEKFPRRQKFLLGDRIQATGLEVLERLIEATYRRSRRDTLAEANLGIEKLRFVLRLSCRCPAGEAASDQAGAWIAHVEQAVSWGLHCAISRGAHPPARTWRAPIGWKGRRRRTVRGEAARSTEGRHPPATFGLSAPRGRGAPRRPRGPGSSTDLPSAPHGPPQRAVKDAAGVIGSDGARGER